MTDLRLAETAKSDVRAIRAFSKAAFGNRIAREYLNGLNGVFALLRERPLIGTPERDFGDGIRRISFRSHRVYYRVTPERIIIARILHHAQDVRLHLGNS